MEKYTIIYGKTCTTIFDSYLIPNEELSKVANKILITRAKYGYETTRSQYSYRCEIKAHNRLYKLHLFRKHTKNADLEEPIKWYLDLLFRIIGR